MLSPIYKINYEAINLEQLITKTLEECQFSDYTTLSQEMKAKAIFSANNLIIYNFINGLSRKNYIAITSKDIGDHYLPVDKILVKNIDNKLTAELKFERDHKVYLSALGVENDITIDLLDNINQELIAENKINLTTTINNRFKVFLLTPTRNNLEPIRKKVAENKENLAKVVKAKLLIETLTCDLPF